MDYIVSVIILQKIKELKLGVAVINLTKYGFIDSLN